MQGAGHPRDMPLRCAHATPLRCIVATVQLPRLPQPGQALPFLGLPPLHPVLPFQHPLLHYQIFNQVVQDMLAGGASHTHDEAEGEQEGCPACGAPAVEAEPAAKVYLSLRRQVGVRGQELCESWGFRFGV